MPAPVIRRHPDAIASIHRTVPRSFRTTPDHTVRSSRAVRHCRKKEPRLLTVGDISCIGIQSRRVRSRQHRWRRLAVTAVRIPTPPHAEIRYPQAAGRPRRAAFSRSPLSGLTASALGGGCRCIGFGGNLERDLPTIRGHKGVDEAAGLLVLTGCEPHLDLVADLYHVPPPAAAIEVVEAVPLELDVPRTLGVAHLERQTHVGIDDPGGLHDAGRLLRLLEVVHRRGVMGLHGKQSTTQDQCCECHSDYIHEPDSTTCLVTLLLVQLFEPVEHLLAMRVTADLQSRMNFPLPSAPRTYG